MIVIGENTVESLILYDADENEVGVADCIAPDEWHCEVRPPGSTTTNNLTSYDDALAWLMLKRNQYFPGGFIDGVATFRIDPVETPVLVEAESGVE